MNNKEVLGAGENEPHKNAKKNLKKFFINNYKNKIQIREPRTVKNGGVFNSIKCVIGDYNYVNTEYVIPIGTTSIIPDVIIGDIIVNDGESKLEPKYIFEVHDTNPVDEEKKEKIVWLIQNKFPRLRVFEVGVDVVDNITDVKVQHGGFAKVITIEREICP